MDVGYAATYWVHGCRESELGASLAEVVRYIRSGSDAGDLAGGDYYALTAEGWAAVPRADVEAEERAYEAEQDAFYAGLANEERWTVEVLGPEGVNAHAGWFSDRGEADAYALTLPKILRPAVKAAVA